MAEHGLPISFLGALQPWARLIALLPAILRFKCRDYAGSVCRQLIQGKLDILLPSTSSHCERWVNNRAISAISHARSARRSGLEQDRPLSVEMLILITSSSARPSLPSDCLPCCFHWHSPVASESYGSHQLLLGTCKKNFFCFCFFGLLSRLQKRY